MYGIYVRNFEGGEDMRKLVLILIAFIAVVTFIRAFDKSAENYSDDLHEQRTVNLIVN